MNLSLSKYKNNKEYIIKFYNENKNGHFMSYYYLNISKCKNEFFAFNFAILYDKYKNKSFIAIIHLLYNINRDIHCTKVTCSTILYDNYTNEYLINMANFINIFIHN